MVEMYGDSVSRAMIVGRAQDLHDAIPIVSHFSHGRILADVTTDDTERIAVHVITQRVDAHYRFRLRWLIRSTRAIRPTNCSPSSTMATRSRSNRGIRASSGSVT